MQVALGSRPRPAALRAAAPHRLRARAGPRRTLAQAAEAGPAAAAAPAPASAAPAGKKAVQPQERLPLPREVACNLEEVGEL